MHLMKLVVRLIHNIQNAKQKRNAENENSNGSEKTGSMYRY